MGTSELIHKHILQPVLFSSGAANLTISAPTQSTFAFIKRNDSPKMLLHLRCAMSYFDMSWRSSAVCVHTMMLLSQSTTSTTATLLFRCRYLFERISFRLLKI